MCGDFVRIEPQNKSDSETLGAVKLRQSLSPEQYAFQDILVSEWMETIPMLWIEMNSWSKPLEYYCHVYICGETHIT
jgi:hypothetical protein